MMRSQNTLFFIFILMIMSTGCQDTNVHIIHNVEGYTATEDSLITFEAMAFNSKSGKILGVGTRSDLAQSFPKNVVIDGGGHTLLPGLIDAHAHVMGLGYARINVTLAGVMSLHAALDTLESYANNYPDMEWIEGHGWNHTHWEIDRFPRAADIDSVISDRPVWLSRVDGHAGWANSKAMEMAGVTADSQAPEDGKIIRDEEGKPTGVFVDAAMQLIEEAIPPKTDSEQQKALQESMKRMREVGLTGVHDAGIDADVYELYRSFVDEEKITTRIYTMIMGTSDNFDELSNNGPVLPYKDDMLALRSVKLYQDGALGSRGAALLEPYSDDPGNHGLLFHTEDELTQKIRKAASAGYQVNIHAIGDRANHVTLNAFENVKQTFGNLDLRHRIEHAQVVQPSDISRFKELGIIASMQPTHATSDMNMAEDRLGADRMEGAYAWQRFIDQGTVLAAGSDFPVESANPFYGLHAAVTRQDHEGNPPGGWYPGQALDRTEALRAFTLNAAYAAHQENELGSLEFGKWADFILIDRNYFEIPENDIWQINVLQTWVGGKKVYDASE